jgi:hypothetical protein
MSYNLNDKISAIWNKFSFEFTDLDAKRCMERVPNYYLKPSPNKILFIGLNPAFQDNKNNINFFYSPPVSEERMNEIALDNENSKTKDKGNYYAKFYNILHAISDELNSEESSQKKFEHCDMFLMRETNSKIVKKMVEKKEGGLNDFGLEQIDILKSYIEDAKPSIIILPNAMTANYYQKYFLENQSINKEKGVYYTEINKRKVTTILCGSWQYGRLDKFTKEIIMFHIKNALKSQ